LEGEEGTGVVSKRAAFIGLRVKSLRMRESRTLFMRARA
jgi:hypothetical protein